MELKKRYIVDLSQAQSPADVVFELSNIIEKPEAANQKIWLKIGDIALNQSQILSINSLISSINSSLALIESQSELTQQSAESLGISIQDVQGEIEKELIENTPESPVVVDVPSEQYIPMTAHVDVEQDSENEIEDKSVELRKSEENLLSALSDDVQDSIPVEEFSVADVVAQKVPEVEVVSSEVETVKQEIPSDDVNEKSVVEEEVIQEHLDSIFDSEVKLENILNEDNDLNSMKNWPLTKEADEFEIPEDVMTDEDFEILQMNTQYHKQTVRSGQVIQSKGNVVIIGDCHPGCEIQAAGDITVWGILGGIAHAGCNGNTKARIRALNLNAIQLRIADSYARRPDHIKNVYVEKSNTFTPEEARNINGSIVILKTNDK